MKYHLYLIVSFFIFLGCTVSNEDGCVLDICTDFKFRVTDSGADFNQNGQLIVFERSSTPAGIYILNLETGEINLFHDWGSNPVWSPDDKWIAFDYGGQIYKKHVDSDSLVKLTNDGRNFVPAWSATTGLIAYRRSLLSEPFEVQGIWVVSEDGGESLQVFSGNSGFPSWHPTENTLLFFRGVIDEEGFVLGDSLWSYNFNDERLNTVTFFDHDNLNPHISVNEQLVFTSQMEEEVPKLWVSDLSDEHTRMRLTEGGAWTPVWSLDGRQIIYTETTDTGRLWIMNSDGSDPKQLTFED